VATISQGAKALKQLSKSGLTSLDNVQLPKISSRVAGAREAMAEGTSSSVSKIGDEIKATGAGEKVSGLGKQAEDALSRSGKTAAATGDEVADITRRLLQLKDEARELRKRKALLEELQDLELRAQTAHHEYTALKPAATVSRLGDATDQLDSVKTSLSLRKQDLAKLRDTPNPSSASLEEIARAEEDVRKLTKRRQALEGFFEKQELEFFGVKSTKEITKDFARRHYEDFMRNTMADNESGKDGLDRLRKLLSDRSVNAPSRTTTDQIEEVSRKLQELHGKITPLEDQAKRAAPAFRPQDGIGYRTKLSTLGVVERDVYPQSEQVQMNPSLPPGSPKK
jgi:chromosome segregation ATPase